MNFIKSELKDYKILLRNVPAMVVSVFILSVVCMNLMASKELYSSTYFCINSGLALSWISFLCMDCIKFLAYYPCNVMEKYFRINGT